MTAPEVDLTRPTEIVDVALAGGCECGTETCYHTAVREIIADRGPWVMEMLVNRWREIGRAPGLAPDPVPGAAEPPPAAVACAVLSGASSPCQKSRRGACVFDSRTGEPLGAGCNGAPLAARPCDGSEACRDACRVRCLHAESRALRFVWPMLLGPYGWQGDAVAHLDVVHAKVVGGRLVWSGGPSCMPCAAEIADAGIRGIWLYERGDGEGDRDDPHRGVWRFYGAREFLRLTTEHHERERAAGSP